VLAELKVVEAVRDKEYRRQRIAGLTDALAREPKAENYAMRGDYYAEPLPAWTSMWLEPFET